MLVVLAAEMTELEEAAGPEAKIFLDGCSRHQNGMSSSLPPPS